MIKLIKFPVRKVCFPAENGTGDLQIMSVGVKTITQSPWVQWKAVGMMTYYHHCLA
jgi:hypothetical protein